MFVPRILLTNSEGFQRVLWPVIMATNTPLINGKEALGAEVSPIQHYSTRILGGQERIFMENPKTSNMGWKHECQVNARSFSATEKMANDSIRQGKKTPGHDLHCPRCTSTFLTSIMWDTDVQKERNFLIEFSALLIHSRPVPTAPHSELMVQYWRLRIFPKAVTKSSFLKKQKSNIF